MTNLHFSHRIASVSPCLTTSHTTHCTWHLAGLHQNIWNNTGSDCKCTPVIVIIVMVLQGSCLFISYTDWCKAAVMTGCRILSRVINCNRYTCNSCNQPTMGFFKPRILLQFTFSNDLVINLNTKRHTNGWWLLLPPPGLALAHAHRLGHGDVAQLVEAAGDDAGEAGAHVQGALRLVPRHHRRHQHQPRYLKRETVFNICIMVYNLITLCQNKISKNEWNGPKCV